MLQAHPLSDPILALFDPIIPFDKEYSSVQQSQTTHGQDLQEQQMAINTQLISPAALTSVFTHTQSDMDNPIASGVVHPATDCMGSELSSSMSHVYQPPNMDELENFYIMGDDLGLSSYLNEV
jgi:hypothetical protein